MHFFTQSPDQKPQITQLLRLYARGRPPDSVTIAPSSTSSSRSSNTSLTKGRDSHLVP